MGQIFVAASSEDLNFKREDFLLKIIQSKKLTWRDFKIFLKPKMVVLNKDSILTKPKMVEWPPY